MVEERDPGQVLTATAVHEKPPVAIEVQRVDTESPAKEAGSFT